jgi:membrane protease YdiL (CAAX protease family)
LRHDLTLARLKDLVKLAAYLVAIVLIAALFAPLLFWLVQWLAAHGAFGFLTKYDFETFFHRALLVAAVLLLWPFLRACHVRSIADLGLAPNPRWGRHFFAGILFAAIPLLVCGALLVGLHVYSIRHVFAWPRLGKVFVASIFVPFIEESFFRGLILGVLLRSGRKYLAMITASGLFAVVHFLKGPERTSEVVTWDSGFNSIAHAFAQFGDVMMVVSAFATLFLMGFILADARVLSRSLWLPVGLHAGWIFASGAFNLLARRQMPALPWLGKNLLVGIIPLGVAALSWIIMRSWLKHDRASKA